MGLFQRDMNETKAAGGGRGLELAEGDYELTIKEVKGIQTRNKGPAMDWIFTITKAEGEGATPVGQTVNEYCIENNDIGAMYLKTLLVVSLGLDNQRSEDQPLIKAEDWNKARDNVAVEKSWAVGRKICCSVQRTGYKNPRTDGKTSYLRRNYAPHPEVRANALKKLAK